MKLVHIGKTFCAIPGCRMHTHPYWHIVLTVSGGGEEIIGDTHTRFSAGDIVCIPPNVPHKRMGDRVFEDIYLCMEGTLSADETVVHLQDDEYHAIEKLMELLHFEWFRHEKKPVASTDCLLMTVVQLIRERIPQEKYDPHIERLHRTVIQRFNDPEFRLKDALATIPYCADHVRRLYRKAYGTTPQKYLLGLRIARAKELLAAGNGGVSEIALQCGFYDAHYFSRTFRNEVGISPAEYGTGYGEKSVLSP